jgi:hypothetical protein
MVRRNGMVAMVRWLAGAVVSVGLMAGTVLPLAADDHPVVVELYTSQGCSSCPPADEMFRDLAARDDVIALSLHVDYWDYIGWADTFARPEFTERQKRYVAAAGENMVFTPHMIVGGAVHLAGVKPMRLAEAIQRLRSGPAPVVLTIRREGPEIEIAAEARTPEPGTMDIQLVRYTAEETVRIGRGENAGRTVTYANIVTQLDTLGTWDGRAPLVMRVAIDGRPDPVVVILQRQGHGPVVAAARLR